MIFKKILVQKSKNGRGIFSQENISKGEKVLTFEGNIISNTEVKKLGHEDHVVPVGENKYIDVSEPESLINHSCEANMGFSTDTTLIALRDIKQGEELTFDYSLVTTDGWEMDCNCGSKVCRGKISDFKKLPIWLQERYREHTPKWLLEIIKLKN